MKLNRLNQQDLQKVEEYIKAKSDIVYFAEHFCKIPTPGGSEIIRLYEPQKDVLRSFVDDHYCVSLKSRQVGFSVMATLFVAYCCTFFENVVCGVISRSADEATDFARKTLNVLDELPDWLRPEFDKRTEQTFILKNGCQLFAAGVNPANPQSVFRGKSLSILIVDEAAFIPGISEAWAGLMPAVSKAQQSARKAGSPYASLVISTPNKTSGMGKFYYDMWTKANAGSGIFKPITLAWWQIKEFADDPQWYKTQCDLLNNVQWKIDQELNCKFIQGGNSFLPAQTIKELQESEKEPLTEINIDGGILKQWKKPDIDRFYLIGVDTASAFGSDSSTIEVIDYIDCEQVAEMRVKCRVDEFCPMVKRVAQMYPNSMVIPEANSFGNSVVEALTKGDGMYNIYQSKTKTKDINRPLKLKYRYGIYTNPVNRPLIIDALYTMLTENPSCIKSRSAILELIGLVSDNKGKIAADEGEHDDLSMALAFCFYVRTYDPPTGLHALSGNKNLLQDVSEIAGWNMEDVNGGGNSLINTSRVKNLNDLDIQEHLTKQVQDFISGNFNALIENYYDQLKGSSQIDVLSLIGRNNY